MTMRNCACLAALVATLTSCVDTSAAGPGPLGAAGAGEGGLSQRLWERYVLHDIQTNVLPAIVTDTGVARLRVYADTLLFGLATGELRETAVIGRFNPDGSESVSTVTSPAGTIYAHGTPETIVFPSLIFGQATATLSGATRIQPFSTTLRIGSSAASYSISF